MTLEIKSTMEGVVIGGVSPATVNSVSDVLLTLVSGILVIMLFHVLVQFYAYGVFQGRKHNVLPQMAEARNIWHMLMHRGIRRTHGTLLILTFAVFHIFLTFMHPMADIGLRFQQEAVATGSIPGLTFERGFGKMQPIAAFQKILPDIIARKPVSEVEFALGTAVEALTLAPEETNREVRKTSACARVLARNAVPQGTFKDAVDVTQCLDTGRIMLEPVPTFQGQTTLNIDYDEVNRMLSFGAQRLWEMGVDVTKVGTTKTTFGQEFTVIGRHTNDSSYAQVQVLNVSNPTVSGIIGEGDSFEFGIETIRQLQSKGSSERGVLISQTTRQFNEQMASCIEYTLGEGNIHSDGNIVTMTQSILSKVKYCRRNEDKIILDRNAITGFLELFINVNQLLNSVRTTLLTDAVFMASIYGTQSAEVPNIENVVVTLVTRLYAGVVIVAISAILVSVAIALLVKIIGTKKFGSFKFYYPKNTLEWMAECIRTTDNPKTGCNESYLDYIQDKVLGLKKTGENTMHRGFYDKTDAYEKGSKIDGAGTGMWPPSEVVENEWRKNMSRFSKFSLLMQTNVMRKWAYGVVRDIMTVSIPNENIISAKFDNDAPEVGMVAEHSLRHGIEGCRQANENPKRKELGMAMFLKTGRCLAEEMLKQGRIKIDLEDQEEVRTLSLVFWSTISLIPKCEEILGFKVTNCKFCTYSHFELYMLKKLVDEVCTLAGTTISPNEEAYTVHFQETIRQAELVSRVMAESLESLPRGGEIIPQSRKQKSIFVIDCTVLGIEKIQMKEMIMSFRRINLNRFLIMTNIDLYMSGFIETVGSGRSKVSKIDLHGSDKTTRTINCAQGKHIAVAHELREYIKKIKTQRAFIQIQKDQEMEEVRQAYATRGGTYSDPDVDVMSEVSFSEGLTIKGYTSSVYSEAETESQKVIGRVSFTIQ